ADTDRAAHKADVQQARDDPHRKGSVPLSRREQRRDLVQVAAGAPDQLDAALVELGPVRRVGLRVGVMSHQPNRPPETWMTSPVTNPASGEARNKTAAATSDGWSYVGSSRSDAVSISPGASALAVIP